MKKDLLSLAECSKNDILMMLDLTDKIKSDKARYACSLKGNSVGLLFQKPSNRTRVSFDVGVFQMGGNCIYLGPNEINLGVRESTQDVAKTLSRYLDLLVARTFAHQDVIELATHASIPVINGLSDLYHPCQALADIFTIREKFSTFENLKLAYIGDGNNVCHSLLLACAHVGLHIHCASPEGYGPREDVLKTANALAAKTKTEVSVSHSPQDAVKDADVIYTDVWVSMGQEGEAQKRLKDLKHFQINNALMRHAEKNHIFMHCLPAHRGQEVSAEVIDGIHSVVFDQAENRMHTQKAVLFSLLGNPE